MLMISQVLQTTANVKEQFRSEFNAALLSYQIDICVMGEEIQRMELEHKELCRRYKGKEKKTVVVVEDDDVDSLPSIHDLQGSDDEDSWSQEEGEEDEESARIVIEPM